jgi:pimeloyl-ACP methyl ester carboxylesterase
MAVRAMSAAPKRGPHVLTDLDDRPHTSGSNGDNHTSTVTIGGLRVRVSRRGEGPPLLLIGGLGNNLGIWEPLVDELSAFETIAVDAPGMGHSSTPMRPLSMFELADFYACLLRTLGITKTAVCGLSFGGAVAQQLTYQCPNLVDKLILCGTGPGVGGVPGSPAALTELAMPWRYYAASRLRNVAPVIYGGRIARDPAALERHFKERLKNPPSVLGYYFQLAALAGWSSLPWLTCLTAPTLIIAGDSDPVFPVENAHMLGRLIPRARVEVLRGGGHMFVVDSAEEVAPFIADFLKPTPE